MTAPSLVPPALIDHPHLVLLDGRSQPDREVVGGKAWGIARMRSLGLPVPPAFAVTTRVCREYAGGEDLPGDVAERVRTAVRGLEEVTGRTFGTGDRPLLVSVRSGAAISMPGMMDTVLDLGLTAAVGDALVAESGDPAWVADLHSRLRSQYEEIIGPVDGSGAVPQDPYEQLRAAICAVFRSWHSPRAEAYRQQYGLADDAGTAVTIQAMVFGNTGDRSGTGVLFSRNPITGAPTPYGEWLPGAQGEDLVSGRRTPLPLESLERAAPEAYAELLRAARALEADAGDMQDIEFTIEDGRLWLLQTRAGKRSPRAAVEVACQLRREGALTPREALLRVRPGQVRALMRPELDDEVKAVARVLAQGTPASPGVASGLAVGDPDEADEMGADGASVVLVRETTSPDDVHGIFAAVAVVTETGGSTSHAALVTRDIGTPCVVGCGSGTSGLLLGRVVTVDGSSGAVYDGELVPSPVDERTDDCLAELLSGAADLLDVQLVDDPRTALVLTSSSDLARLDPAVPVTGPLLEDDAGFVAAVAAGARTFAVEHPLPGLLAAVHATRTPTA